MADPVTRFQLANGLLVLLKEIHTAPLISHWIWYRVGSRDESPGHTGLSHWVEHMQFKGTPEYPAGVLERAISREGGGWNALTFLDWTAYYEILPSHRIELALHLEADRMTNSLFEPAEVESERTVIISERQGQENEPVFRLSEEVQSAAFQVHAYHHLTIGDLADLQAANREDLYDHYRKYYIPNNAVLAIGGDFHTASMIDLVRLYYESIPAGAIYPTSSQVEPAQTSERRVTVEGPGDTTYVLLSYHVPQATHPDFFACLILDSLLTGPSGLNLFGGGISNKTSRLYRLLVESGLAVSVTGGLQPTLDPFLYAILIIVHPGVDPERVIACVDQEIQNIVVNQPGPAELLRAVKQARALFAYGSETISNQAYWLGLSEMFASYEWFTSYLDRLAAVTPEAVQRAAQIYLQPNNRVAGIYLPVASEAHVNG